MGPGGTRGQDTLRPAISPWGMLLSSPPGLGVSHCTSPTTPTSAVEGREADESRLCKELWDRPKSEVPSQHKTLSLLLLDPRELSTKGCHTSGLSPFTPALKMPAEEKAFNCLCFSLPHYHWGKYHLTR